MGGEQVVDSPAKTQAAFTIMPFEHRKTERPHYQTFSCMRDSSTVDFTAVVKDSFGGDHRETQEEVTVLGEVFLRRPAVLVSGALVLLGVLDCLVSLACAAISAREACGLYSKGEDTTQGLSEGHNRKERLYRWLGQQKTIFPIGSSQGPPRGVSSVSQFVPLSSDSSSSSATPRKSSSGPSGASSSLPSASSHRVLPSSGSSSGQTNSTRVAPPSVPSILKPSSLPSLHGSKSLPPTSSTAAVGVPYRHKHAPAAQTSEHVPSAFSHSQHGAKLNMAPHLHQPHHQMHPHPHSLPLPHPHAHPHPHPHPHAHPQHPPIHPHQLPQHFPAHAAHPSLYYPHLVTPMIPYYPTDQDLQQTRKHKKKESSKKRKDGKNKQKEEEKKKKKERKRKSKELTDEQIERTYTGLDRELAEEFIDSTMEPGLSLQRAFNTSFDQDSF
ncbi:cyclic AMP-responsive element-binding protein 5-like [Penaeus monodon]|uniref:cyclic AMP-responsive element-binding protein 5-like n=1 Tax=Penaeus monodon TaxID=6687 RepID=UPI0018A792E5|nr:cyclic AMP-responsive element-binding protein 5-like [Penaeus monodon]